MQSGRADSIYPTACSDCRAVSSACLEAEHKWEAIRYLWRLNSLTLIHCQRALLDVTLYHSAHFCLAVFTTNSTLTSSQHSQHAFVTMQYKTLINDTIMAFTFVSVQITVLVWWDIRYSFGTLLSRLIKTLINNNIKTMSAHICATLSKTAVRRDN